MKNYIKTDFLISFNDQYRAILTGCDDSFMDIDKQYRQQEKVQSYFRLILLAVKILVHLELIVM